MGEEEVSALADRGPIDPDALDKEQGRGPEVSVSGMRKSSSATLSGAMTATAVYRVFPTRPAWRTFWPWGIAAGDFDNDGFEDLFLPVGHGLPLLLLAQLSA